MNTQQRANAITILILKVHTTLTNDIVVDTGLLDLETRCVNQKVQFVLMSLEDWPFGADLCNAFTLGIYQMNIRQIERRKILIMEARPLTHKHIPGLQSVRSRLVINYFIDPPMDAHHVIDVSVFLLLQFVFG